MHWGNTCKNCSVWLLLPCLLYHCPDKWFLVHKLKNDDTLKESKQKEFQVAFQLKITRPPLREFKLELVPQRLLKTISPTICNYVYLNTFFQFWKEYALRIFIDFSKRCYELKSCFTYTIQNLSSQGKEKKCSDPCWFSSGAWMGIPAQFRKRPLCR